MPDFADVVSRKMRQAAAVNDRAARQQYIDSQPEREGTNAFADAFAERVTEARLERAQESVLDARDEVARLRREHAHRDDVAEAFEVLAEARAEVRRLRGS